MNYIMEVFIYNYYDDQNIMSLLKAIQTYCIERILLLINRKKINILETIVAINE
jgi:hypothetical protein